MNASEDTSMSPSQAEKLEDIRTRFRDLEKSHAVLASEVKRLGWFIWGSLAGVGTLAIGLIIEMSKQP